MRNFVKATVLVAFLSFGGWALTTKPTVYREKNVQDKDTQKTSARDLYLQNCARCHGDDGKSQSKLGKSLGATDLTSREVQKMSKKSVTKTITHGINEMPGFDKKLSKKQIKALGKFISSF